MNEPTNHKEPLAEKIIERIEHEGMTPRPRWQFMLANQTLWAVFALSLILATAASAAMLFALANAGWEFSDVTHDNYLSFLWDVLPFIWIAAIALFVLIAYENVRHTKLGYRYPTRLILVLASLGVVIGGFVLFMSGLGQNVEQEFGKRIPRYRPTVEFQRKMWMNPSRGLLGGEVLRAEPEYATFTLRTFDGKEWIVNGDDLRGPDRDFLASSHPVRIVGVPIEATTTFDLPTFHACSIFPWEIRRRFPFPQERMPERNTFEERSTLCKGIRLYRGSPSSTEGKGF